MRRQTVSTNVSVSTESHFRLMWTQFLKKMGDDTDLVYHTWKCLSLCVNWKNGYAVWCVLCASELYAFGGHENLEFCFLLAPFLEACSPWSKMWLLIKLPSDLSIFCTNSTHLETTCPKCALSRRPLRQHSCICFVYKQISLKCCQIHCYCY